MGASGAIGCQRCASCTCVGASIATAHVRSTGTSGAWTCGDDCADSCSIGDACVGARGGICCQRCAGTAGVGACHAAAHVLSTGTGCA